MIEAGCAESTAQEGRRHFVARWTAGGLALAASPTFAVMALLSAVAQDGHAATHGMAGHASPLTGMVTMYVLMSVFHAPPWVRLFRAGTRTERF